ncbi:hypothetical protein RF11_02708 [Thelohanellus kitauei]|uniref:Uncharacterized protein n=1 Tax=Thelohanellus kitauei TaxID=669202 RepID=A0A0C2J851_THEKT|nr:hypothetical protein RF11_02708 [Thelohanellus kitauei]
MENVISHDEIEKVKQRLTEQGVIIGIPSERLRDVYGLDEMKDKFFTLIVLPLLQPNLFEGVERVRNILIKQPIDRGLSHFIRAFAGEYCLNLVTIDGRWFKNRLSDCIRQISSDLKYILVALKPSILFIRNMCDMKKFEPNFCYLQESVDLHCQINTESVYTIMACNTNKDIRRKIFEDHAKDVEKNITHELFDQLVCEIPMKDFEKILSLCLYARGSNHFNRNSYKTSHEYHHNHDSATKSFEGLKNALKCSVNVCSLPPLNDYDIKEAMKIYSSGELSKIKD